MWASELIETKTEVHSSLPGSEVPHSGAPTAFGLGPGGRMVEPCAAALRRRCVWGRSLRHGRSPPPDSVVSWEGQLTAQCLLAD